jgi:uncharacterized protein (TIGR00255 family)
MLKSMTGYGQVQLDNDDYQVLVEIKSLNSKYLDINLKVPKQFSEKELKIRNLAGEKLERGKVMITIEFQKKSISDLPTTINQELFQFYYNHFKKLAVKVGASEQELFKLSLQAPEVMITTLDNPSIEDDYAIVEKLIAEALDKCNIFRDREGAELKKNLIDYVDIIDQNLKFLEEHEPERLNIVKDRLRNNLKELANNSDYDQNRFEQELIFYIEKLDISEEKVRLRSHLSYFKEMMEKGGPHGKKLNFISQEMGREINTLGSKANHASIQKHVVIMKEELEKIKEQVLNIL